MKMLNHLDFSVLRSSDRSKPAGHLFALIDHSAMPGLVSKLNKVSTEWLSLFAGSRDEGALEVAPVLFSIEGRDNLFQRKELLKWICSQGTYSSSIIFIESPLPLSELGRRLALRLDATLQGEIDIFLRFFDTRIFEKLMAVLSVEQINAFLNVAHCWWFVDRKGMLQSVEADFSDFEVPTIPLDLTQLQEDAMLDHSIPDQIIGMLTESVPRELENLPIDSRHDFVLRHIAAANDAGIKETHELVLYCALALLHGELFSQEKNWTILLNDVRSKKTSLTEIVQGLEINSN